MNDPREAVAECGPWNPGLQSQLPRELMPLATMFRAENVRTTLDGARERAELIGLSLFDVVAFRPERLALHEVMIRVMADLSVPIGSRVEDLGINFRRMTDTLFAKDIVPRIAEVTAAYEALRRRVATLVDAELEAKIFSVKATERVEKHRWLDRFRHASASGRVVTGDETRSDRARNAIGDWKAASQSSTDAAQKATYIALAKITSALLAQHGSVWGTAELVGSITTDVALNDAGSQAIGALIEPYFRDGAHREGYRLLPPQARPVIMNTKGASAAGKSTMRTEQKMLAERIGVDWDEFAVISPDIWRKELLDYASLGRWYKYGGACTGDELRIIDQKLDRYMARKAERHATTHLLIDRFRFDSFAPDSDEAGSNLLTRFGHTVYLFFMVTPPGAIVERAWQRGLDVGRYKAVDDLLAHNVEAYTGMPELFFTWALRADKAVHYEFLDNSVPFGQRPRTVAFGWNGELNILDVGSLVDIERFRRVNVNARSPEELFESRSVLASERNTGFLVECASRLPRIHFADQASGRIYLRIEAGTPTWADADALEAAMTDADTRAGILAIAPDIAKRALPDAQAPLYLATTLGTERIHTLGAWGAAGAGATRA